MPYPLLVKIVPLIVMFILGCSMESLRSQPVPATLVSADELPPLKDDLALEGLSYAVERQLVVLRHEGDREALRIGKTRFHTKHIRQSLERLSRLLAERELCLKNGQPADDCDERFNQQVRNQFLVYRLQPALLTAYYTPTIEVSAQRSEQFRYPIYRTPATQWERRLSREEIDFSGKLEGKGYELYYAADRFDLYITHVEGAARLIVNDNGQRYIKYLHYHTDNGQEFTHLHDYMLSHGLLSSSRQSRWDQRAALEAHPDKVRRVYANSPGYVFFKVSDRPSITHTGAILTANRSIATDPAYYPVKGLITFVVAPLPLPPAAGVPSESNPKGIKYQTMQRYFIDQDIGNHVEGAARADLFFGDDSYAEFLSNNFMINGTLYLLLSK